MGGGSPSAQVETLLRAFYLKAGAASTSLINPRLS
jgi:hypothetical protein